MAFKMSFDSKELKGPEAVPAGLYTVRFLSFKPKISSKEDSINYNACVEIIDPPVDSNQSRIYALLNTKIASWIQDFVHSFGIEMEYDSSDDSYKIPGTWDADPASFDPNDFKTYKYEGPLTGKTAIWEIVPGADLNGKPKSTPNRFLCSVSNCASRFPDIKHSTKMVK